MAGIKYSRTDLHTHTHTHTVDNLFVIILALIDFHRTKHYSCILSAIFPESSLDTLLWVNPGDGFNKELFYYFINCAKSHTGGNLFMCW